MAFDASTSTEACIARFGNYARAIGCTNAGSVRACDL